MLSAVQRKIIDAITSIHETGRYNINSYGAVANVKGDTGGISYGTHQASITSGNLYLLLQRYVEAKGQFSASFAPYMAKAKAKDKSLGNTPAFSALLVKAGGDPIMVIVQDDFFYHQFMEPAVNAGNKYGFIQPLSFAVIFDGFIQGAWGAMRDRTNKVARTSEEKKWIAEYLKQRRSWLSSKSKLLARTIYRVDTFLDLIKANNWSLNLPISCHGVKLTAAMLGVIAPIDIAAVPVIEDKNLVKAPEIVTLANGDKDDSDNAITVTMLQKALLAKNFYKSRIDGDFGDATENAVIAFQKANGLKPDGIAGLRTFDALDLI